MNGEQYVAVQVGYGGTPITVAPIPPSSAALKYQNTNRIIAFKLGGGAVPMPPARVEPPFPKPPEQKATQAQIDAGEIIFIEQCTRCHQLGPSIDAGSAQRSMTVCMSHSRTFYCEACWRPAGMERFNDILSEKDADNVHAYLIEQSWIAYREQEKSAAAKK